ncbi:hypothetical protein [Curtobacterium sp. MCBD17_040]|uniref:hypothetical protein n=1 Tax=Curtobacterium sp. MCBD17_040 TaxID=2175674 RepID=UPI0015E899BC|nr:hypothetical protein [Curtobacterium sp. MCBD17_040]WIB65503.1 hypothetical protein DEI94_19205 [Curtobacterium sp. MCBD17_040]
MTRSTTCTYCTATLDLTGASDDLFAWGVHRGWVLAKRADTTWAYCPNHADITGATRNR